MKKLFFLLGGLLSFGVITAQNIQNQAISYSDGAILFSADEQFGTARYNALSGAFGALGGDFSAIEINPAGTAVFANSAFGVTFGLRKAQTNSTFYGSSVLNEDDYFNLNQAGGTLVFDTDGHSNWSKFTLGFNYSLSQDFENSWLTRGNSGFAPLTDAYDPGPNSVYPNAEEQIFRNTTNGENKKFVISIASQYEDNLYLGASLITHDLDFFQLAQAEELNNDGSGNTFDVLATQRLQTIGNGVAFSAGLIAKPVQELRLGVAVQTPTWYNLTEVLDINQHEIYINDDLDDPIEEFQFTELDYKITTPARLTGSIAYIFGKQGLISFDYTYKDYKNIKLRPSVEFDGENQDLRDNLKGTSQFKVGAEIRLDNISLRGGYHFEESPFKTPPINSIKRTYGDIKGYSFGVGFKIGSNVSLDLAYQNSKNTDQFKFQDIINADPANLDIRNDRFSASLVIGL